MRIHSCEKCGTKFKYKTIWKVLIMGREEHYRNITCENCGTAYYIKQSSKVLYVILLAFPLFLNTFFLHNKPSVPVNLTLYIFYMAVILILHPYIVKYEIEKIDQEKDDSINEDS